jgi:hypothetical protein
MKMFWLKIRWEILQWKRKHRKPQKLIPEPRYDKVYFEALKIMNKEESEALEGK